MWALLWALPTLPAFLTAGLDRDFSHQVTELAMVNREDCHFKSRIRVEMQSQKSA